MATYTYSGDPSASARDEVRYYLQDVASPWLASDEEIAFALTKNGQRPRASAADLARVKASAFLRRGTVSIDGMMINYTERGNALLALAKQIEQDDYNAGAGALPFAGGVSKSLDAALRSDSDGYNGVSSILQPEGEQAP